MSIKSKLNYIVMMIAPNPIREFLSRKTASLMLSEIRSLKIESCGVILIDEVSYPTIKLQNGPALIGELPTRQERAIFGWVMSELGLTQNHAKVSIDAITRFRYAHSAIGYLEFPARPGPNHFFHPQHESFAMLEETFSPEVRKKIAKIFRPSSGWQILDVGGYLGHGMLSMIEEVGATGRIICVEAKEENVKVIEEHLKVNEIENVQVMHRAIFSKSDVPIEFTLSSRQANAIDSELVSGTTRTVDSISIASLVERLDARPDFISLTVNGAELDAIEGMATMEKNRLPLRIMAPGWYKLKGSPRFYKISEILQQTGYRVEITASGMIYAWLPEVEKL